MKKKQIKSFSLIEVLVFVTILSIFFVTAIAILTVALRNMKVNEQKIIATRYAEELMEWLKSQKEIDWNIFTAKGDASGITYCFNEPLSEPYSWVTGPCDLFNGIIGRTPEIYKREAILKNDLGSPVTQVAVTVNVKWKKEVLPDYIISLQSSFSIWE